MSKRTLRSLPLCCLFGILLFGCDVPPAKAPNGSADTADVSGLLPFQGPVRSLFDDGIDAELFGTPDERAGEIDPRILERVRAASLVVVVHVTTVTGEGQAPNERLELELAPIEKPLRDTTGVITEASEPIKLTMSPGTASFVLVRSNQSDLIGKRLILCLGRFVENGKAVTHWHGMVDGPKVRQAVTSAASMADLEN